MKRKLMVTFTSLLVALAAAAVPIAFSSQFHVPTTNFDRQIRNSAMALFEEGKETFRFDTFGDEAFWGDTLQLHRAIAKVTPRTALAIGLKVDSEALPSDVAEKIRKGQVNLDSPETTIALLRLNSYGTFAKKPVSVIPRKMCRSANFPSWIGGVAAP